MHTLLSNLHKKHFRVPEPPIDPPEPDEATIERNLRNSIRQDCLDAIGTLTDRLDELNHDGIHRHTQKYLGNLKDYLEREIEDD